MKKTNQLILAFTVGLPVIAAQGQIESGLIGYWEFEDNLTETSNTHPAGTHDGLAQGTIGYGAGPSTTFGQALDLTGSGGVYVTNSSTLDVGYLPTFDDAINTAGAMSVAFWAKGWPERWNPFVGKYGEGDFGWQVRRRHSSSDAVFTIRSTDGDDDPNSASNDAGSSSTVWIHYVATWDNTGNRKLYVNGVEDASNSLTNDTSTATGGPGNAPAYDLAFGMRSLGDGAVGNFFTGQIDDIAIWNRALSQSEVTQLGANSLATLMNGFLDSDGDLISDSDEINIYSTNPNEPDSDFDGVNDFVEIQKESDPTQDNDFDNDGLTNAQETSGSANPFGSPGDGAAGEPTDWCEPDSDGDGINDGEEVIAGTDTYVTNPNESDTDLDGFTDGYEVNPITVGNPIDPLITPTEWERDLTGYWKFDGDLTDSGALAADGVMGGDSDVETYATGQFGQAIDLDKVSNQQVEVSGSESNFDATGSSLTVSTWILAEALDDQWQAIIAKGEGASWRLARRHTSTGAGFSAGTSGGDAPSTNEIASSHPIDDGAWHHIVGVAEVGYGISIWVDGVLVETRTDNDPNITDSVHSLIIGGNPEVVRTWNGNLDDVAVWKRALTNEEVSELYTNGNSLQFLIDNNVEPTPLPEGPVVLESFGFANDGSFSIEASSLTVTRTYQMMSSLLLDGTDWTEVGSTFTGGTTNTFIDPAPPTGADAKSFYSIFDVTP